jgi:hypothetical protein
VAAVFTTSVFFGISVFFSFTEVKQNIIFWSELSPGGLALLVDEPNSFYSFAANLNIKCGGQVWSYHSKFYAPGMEPEDLIEGFTGEYLDCEIR